MDRINESMNKIILLTLLFFINPVYAKLNKCQTAGGKFIYSQFACKKDQKATNLTVDNEKPLYKARRKVNALIKDTNEYEEQISRNGGLRSGNLEFINKRRVLIKNLNEQIDFLKGYNGNDKTAKLQQLVWSIPSINNRTIKRQPEIPVEVHNTKKASTQEDRRQASLRYSQDRQNFIRRSQEEKKHQKRREKYQEVHDTYSKLKANRNIFTKHDFNKAIDEYRTHH